MNGFTFRKIIGFIRINLRDLVKIYYNKKYTEKIFNKIGFCNQKTDQGAHSFLTEIRKLFTKLHPTKYLEWELRRTNENL